MICPIVCLRWSWFKVNVFLTMLASKMIKLFFKFMEFNVKKASLNSSSAYLSINLMLIFSIKIYMLYSNLLMMFRI